MSDPVKTRFYRPPGDGAQTGRPAVLCHFAGRSPWSGRERAGAIRARRNFSMTDLQLTWEVSVAFHTRITDTDMIGGNYVNQTRIDI